MKERYFTDQLLDQQALALYLDLPEQPQKKTISFQPTRSALLVLDMQAYFLDPASHAYIPSAEAILDGIVELIKVFYDRGLPVIFSQHINTENDAGMMSAWWKDMITAQNPRHKIAPELDVSKGIVIQKSQYDAFHQTRLDEILRSKEVSQVVICGVMTHLCCETTARSAFMKGFQVFFPVDGTATYNLGFHRASLINLAHGFASIVLIKDLMEALRGEHAR